MVYTIYWRKNEVSEWKEEVKREADTPVKALNKYTYDYGQFIYDNEYVKVVDEQGVEFGPYLRGVDF